MSNGSNPYEDFSMLDLFRMEIENQVEHLNAELLRLESDPADAETLETLMRACHSVKGAARIVKLQPIVELAHGMEDCFSSAQSEPAFLDTPAIDTLLRGVDLLTQIAQTPSGNIIEWIEANQSSLQELTQQIRRLASEGAKDESSQPPAEMPGIPTPNPSQPSPPTPPSPVQPPASPPPPSGPEPAESPESEAPETPEPADESPRRDRVAARGVRVGAENLDRFMNLTGEALIQNRWLRPYSRSLLDLRRKQWKLERELNKLTDEILSHKEYRGLRHQVTPLVNRAVRCRELLTDRYNEFEDFARRLSNLTNRIYREVLDTRMRPFSEGVQGFPRMVRDLAKQLQKQIDFQIHGQATMVDRDVLEQLESPLTHLLRNAVDHGVESSEEREAAGKPPTGHVSLEACHQAGRLMITVRDDGRGIDPEIIRRRVKDQGMIEPQVADQLTEPELYDFLFLPRFTTTDRVTEISGRGFGLDIVQTLVQEVRGSVRVHSEPGRGLVVQLMLPVTLSIVRALLVSIAEEPYALPLARINRVMRVPKDEIQQIENKQYVAINDQHVGLVAAQQILELDEEPNDADELNVVFIEDRERVYGLVVDHLKGEQNLVVRPLDPRLGKVPDISAAGMLQDGSPVLILDVGDIVRSIEKLLSQERLRKVHVDEEEEMFTAQKRILIVDDSLTVREVERRLLESAGYLVDVAVDGVDGWNAMKMQTFDLVVTDIDMPRMNGFELVQQIRNEPGTRGVPVIVVSYKDREEDRMRGLQAGANYYLAKSSFHDESLLQAVEELIG